MGVLPLQFKAGTNRQTLKLTGMELFDISGFEQNLKPRMEINCVIHRTDGSQEIISLLSRIDTLDEVEYFLNDGILHYVLRNLLNSPARL